MKKKKPPKNQKRISKDCGITTKGKTYVQLEQKEKKERKEQKKYLKQ